MSCCYIGMSAEDDDEAAAIALSLGQPAPEAAPALEAPAPAAAASDLEAQVVEFAGCSLSVARAAVAAAGPAGLARAVDLALSGDLELHGDDWLSASGPHKAVCLVRRDLNMGAGKVAAQVAHSVLGVYRLAQERCPAVLHSWVGGGEAIIVLGVDGRDEMRALLTAAAERGLCTHRVADAGRTEVVPGTETVGCIGPAPVQIVDTVTGHLGLL